MSRHAATVAVALITVLACVARFFGIQHEPLWLDEGYTLLFSGLSLPRLLIVGGAHEHPPLYYLVVHFLLAIHPSYLVPRFISAAAGTLSVPVLYALGRRLFGLGTGLIAAALLAVSPFHLWYSQDGRAYELAGLFVLLSYLALFSAVDSHTARRWALYGIATVLAFYTEYTTIFVIVPQALMLRRRLRPLLLTWLAIAIAYVPWIGILLRDASSVASAYWIPKPTLNSVATTILEFTGAAVPCPSPPCVPQALPGVVAHEVLIAAGVLLLVAAIAVWGIASCRVGGVLVAWLVLPFLVVLALSPIRSLYVDRAFLDASFPLYLLTAHALVRIWAICRWPALAVLLLLSTATSSIVYADTSNPDWRSLGRDLGTAYRPGQAVMFNPGVLMTLLHVYLPPRWHPTRQRGLWARSYLDIPGWQRYYPDAGRSDPADIRRVEAVLRNRQLASVARNERDVWLVTYNYSGFSDTRRWFIQHGFEPIISELYQGDTRLELWSRSSPAGLGPADFSPGFGRWRTQGRVRISGATAIENGASALRRTFMVRAGTAYSVDLRYRGVPPSSPYVNVSMLSRPGHVLATFPRTQWYELPVPGVWLHQPFGFVAPPGSSRAVITLGNRWGTVRWQATLYRER